MRWFLVPVVALIWALLPGCGGGGPPPNSVSRIVYQKHESSADGLYMMSPDGTGAVRLTTERTDEKPTISPNGQRIAFASGGTNQQQLFHVHTDGTSRYQVTVGAPASKWDPDWLPTSLGLVFSAESVEQREIYSVALNNSNLAQLTHDDYPDTRPDCAPGMTFIAYQSYRDHRFHIYRVNVSGGDEHPLTAGANDNAYPCYTPDGEKIVFTSTRDGNQEIYIMTADGLAPTRLTNSSAIDCKPTVSPDGEQIAFTSYRDGNAEIYRMDLDGTDQVRLTNDPAEDDEADWDWVVP